MKAIHISQPGNMAVIHIDPPVLKPDDVLLKIHYVAFCGSDLNTFCGKNPMVTLPVIPGHEIGATIEAVGAAVPPHLKPGLPCTVNPYTACGNCTSCRNGRPNACRTNQTLGVQRHGAMSEYLLVPWQKVIADEAINPMQFTLVEPMSVGFHAVARAEVTDLDTVLVIGCGMIGVGAVIRSAIRGAKVMVVDMDENKLNLAKRLGAHATINHATESVTEKIRALTGGHGPDVVIEAVGVPSTYQLAVNEVAFAGRVVYIGYAKSEIAFETKYFVQKELDIRGSRNAMPEDFRAVMEYMKRGDCPTQELISGVYAPEQAQEAMEKWASDPSKVFRIFIEFNP